MSRGCKRKLPSVTGQFTRGYPATWNSKNIAARALSHGSDPVFQSIVISPNFGIPPNHPLERRLEWQAHLSERQISFACWTSRGRFADGPVLKVQDQLPVLTSTISCGADSR